MKLSDLRVGQRATILQVEGSGIFRKRILEMGFVRGKEIRVERVAPLGDPVYYRILNYNVSLRREDAARIQVSLLPELSEAEPAYEQQTTPPLRDDFVYGEADNTIFSDKSHTQHTDSKRIRVALVGNPNCGKTTLFNLASGAHERVGNYGGVTIEAKEAHFNYKGYRIDIIDLPGSYSLSPYSPEELYIRQYLTGDERPDVVLNVVDTTNLERNLYLTLQVKELGLPVVMALNMFDEFEKSGDRFDHKTLSRLLGIPMEPTISRTGFGIDNLFDRILSIFYGQDKYVRPIKINYGTVVEPFVEELQEKIREYLPEIPAHIPTRYVAVKLLEQDEEVERSIKAVCKKADFILTARNYALESATALLKGERVDTVITDQRYGYIVGALRETYHTKQTNRALRVIA